MDGNVDEGRDEAGYQGRPGGQEYIPEMPQMMERVVVGRGRGVVDNRLERAEVASDENNIKKINEVVRAAKRVKEYVEGAAVPLDGEASGHQVLQLRGGGSNLLKQFIVIFKNVRSVQTEERLEELLVECDAIEWDVILVNETWRGQSEEIVKLKGGHMWFGSSGSAGKHGVGILLHRRWSFQRFRAVSSRLCMLEVDADERKFNFIVAYMPHGGYSDEEVEAMYSAISLQIKDARKRRRSIVLGGDFNAEVQASSTPSVGPYTNTQGNTRGEWLANWACKEGLLIMNTRFRKRWGLVWTHCQKGRKLQIDYILVDKGLGPCGTDAAVQKKIDLGSDHRAVQLTMDLAPSRRRRKFVPKRCSVVGWEPADANKYAEMLDNRLADVRVAEHLDWLDKSIDEKLADLEKIIPKTAHECRKLQKQHEDARVFMPSDLMERRRQLRSSGESVACISKEIQK